ncbi:hypothetical protein CgunFtcFv8_026926 [Champsocephalus gunnari]|uniref:Uncharacterized protein n=1 Tax=Champsocephalus gunnari TaxID=52237 RepID=A0AAN8DXZ9_CHAGU|nr:hypothetical protein CgunFtcFv8_026926 [Champsocephalus gunnari]
METVDCGKRKRPRGWRQHQKRGGGGLGMVWEVKAVHVNHTGLGRGKVGGGDGPEQAPVIKKKATEGTSLDGRGDE